MTQAPETNTASSFLAMARALHADVKKEVKERRERFHAADRLIRKNVAAGAPRLHGKRKLCLSLGELAQHGEAVLERRRCHHQLMFLVPLMRHLEKELNRGVLFEDDDSLGALAYRITHEPVSALNLAGDVAMHLVDKYASLVEPYIFNIRMPKPSRLDLLQEPHISRRKQALYAKLKEAVQLTPDEDSLLRGALALAPESRIRRRTR